MEFKLKFRINIPRLCLMILLLFMLAPQRASSQTSNVSESVAHTQPSSFWDISFWITPGGDGTSLFVYTGPTTQLSSEVEASLDLGPGPDVSIGMTFNEDSGTYEGTISEVVTPGSDTVNGSIGLSSTLNGNTLNSSQIAFRRFFVPTTNAPPILSPDNRLEVIINDNSLPTDAYAVIMQTNALPAPPPLGYQLVAPPYTLRASGANPESDNNMIMSMYYGDLFLGNLPTRTLRFMQWDNNSWQEVGGDLEDLFSETLTSTTRQFAVYALMAGPSWRDSFYNFNGLSEWDNLMISSSENGIALVGASLTGYAISAPITPTLPIKSWGYLNFTRTLVTNTTLIVDVLDMDGNVILPDVDDGTSLASLNPTLYPALRLRATFTTTDPTLSAHLRFWELSWITQNHQIFLPTIFRPN